MTFAQGDEASGHTQVGSPRVVLSRPLCFAVASLTYVSLMASAGVPAPLYTLYESGFAISSGAITGSYAAYIFAAAVAMLTVGRLSDHVGRRPVVFAAIGLAIGACVVLIRLDGPHSLVVGRVLQGLVVGLAMSGVGAFVVDLCRPGRTFLVSVVSSATPTLGVGVGAVLSGVLLDQAPLPLSLVYLIVMAVLVVCAVGLLFVPETVALPGGRPDLEQTLRSMRPRLAVRPRQRRLFAGVVAAFVAAWTLGGFYQSLGPRFARDLLYGDTHVFSGLVVASVLAVTATGGPLTAALAPRRATLVGLATLAVGTLMIVWALGAHQTPAFFVASFVAGAGFGAATAGAMRSLLADVDNTEVAGIFSAVYLVSYLGAAVPAFLGGRLIPPFGLMWVTVGYAGLVLALAVAAGVIVTVTGRASDRRSAQVAEPG